MFCTESSVEMVAEDLAQRLPVVTRHRIIHPAAIAAHVDTGTAKGLAALNAMITDQAMMIAYLDDFWIMMVMTLAAIPFLLLIKGAKPAAGEHKAVLE